MTVNFSVDAIEAQIVVGGGVYITPLFLNLGTRLCCVVNFPPPTGGGGAAHVRYGGGWASESVWTFWSALVIAGHRTTISRTSST
jgi:hypothetical protein